MISGCASKARTSDLPIVQVCFLASCNVVSSERGAALDDLEDSNAAATFNENVEQGAEASTALEIP